VTWFPPPTIVFRRGGAWLIYGAVIYKPWLAAAALGVFLPGRPVCYFPPKPPAAPGETASRRPEKKSGTMKPGEKPPPASASREDATVPGPIGFRWKRGGIGASCAAMQAGLRMKDMPAAERPRERLREHGADALSNAELIAILLRTGTRGASALEIGGRLVARYQRLEDLARASLDELGQAPGVGRDKAVTLKAAFKLAERMAREIRAEAPLLDSPDKVAALLREENRYYEKEQFQVILLNTRRRLIRVERLASGTLDAVQVHPRDVFRPAIQANASAVIVVHNHPSGDPSPSEPDIRITRDLVRAGQLLNIQVLDHVILGKATQERPKDFLSLRELGYLYQ
jgi:DNA repair protein RadC